MRLPLPFLGCLLLAASCQNHPVQQAESNTAAAPHPVPEAALRETHWVLRQLAGQSISLPPDTREVFLTLRADGTAEGNGGGNRFRGSFFSATPGELKFSPLMSTRMSCPAIGTENDFTRALGQSRTYRISGDTLRVLAADGAVVARLEAVYLR